MFDHVGIRVKDFAKSKAFYVKVLETLGHKLLKEYTPEQTGGSAAAGFGTAMPQFWIGTTSPAGPGHIAFTAKDKAQVEAFYKAALAAGGKDFGAPGPRPEYHQSYYGAFVLDPDGNNVEAVIHNFKP
ncbi:MAG: VOC family protein [Archangiaceae bacterium]|nr:VOC family protein [Archangiaceae bacterium]